ncbi:uncharacterized protein LOC135218610 isoform X2 [Macrobrachium nipponense]|uniref:uncharacterized protein LOC135218610 isoform X2 n=1 Tax=Macrobrachium nipponense TaxID=159736 RepID=UPI0030C7A45D
MNRNANKSLKRKVIEYQDGEIDEDGRASKEAKRDTSNSSISSSFSTLALRRLVPEDWNPSPISRKQDEENEDSFEKTGDRTVDRGTLWSGKDVCQEPQGISQLYMACNRSVKKSSSCDCETQTYYFVPNSHDTRNEVSKDKGLVRECCVIGCKYNSEEDSSVSYYGLPSSKAERSLWADTLGLKFASASKGEIQEICSRHFDASISPQSSLPKVSHTPKSKTRKKKTCDILIAEEAEKVKQSMATGRAKRTPKPNRNYDWAELMPLIKSETEDYEMEAAMSKNPGKRRKQLLDYIKKGKKGNERSFMEMHVNLDDEVEESDSESDEYDVGNISLPSLPRPPPPKGKGRPHRIQDTCTQTESSLNSRGPLREVKVQCNLTAEPLVSCSSCSSIDWRSLDEELSQIMSVIECEIVNPILSRCLSNALSEHAIPSHAANVLKMIAGLPRDYLEDRKDIHIVPGEDEFDEVEIEKFIHQEEGPIVGIREIIAKDWNKKAKTVRTTASKRDEDILDDPDSFGLKEATDKDDDEFNPEGAAVEEDDDDYEEDDDWDIKKDDSGASIQKKKTRLKAKKGGDKTYTLGELKLSASGSVFSNAEIPDKSCMKISLGTKKQSLVEQPEPVAGSKLYFQCDECDKEFTQRQALRYHKIWRHNAERLGPCPYCSYKAPDATKLRDHIKKVHHGFMPYKCKFCSKQFKCHSNHKEHEARHQGTGNFKCKFCCKKFAISSSLERHERYHLSSRPYMCSYCEKGFKAKTHLERHIKCIHLKEKNIFCELCGKPHFSNWNLKMHMKAHEDTQKGVVKSCIICNCKFKNNTGLAAHMRKLHNVTSLYFEEAKLDATIQDSTSATREDSGKLITSGVAVSTCGSYDISNYSEDDCKAVTSQRNSVEDEEASIYSASEISEHRTIVIQDGSICSDLSDMKEESTLIYADFLSDSSVHTFELYTCNVCSSVFQSKEVFLNHEHIPQ